MTNFQAEQLISPKWLTPERSVVFLPAFIGAAISVFVASFVFVPIVFGVRERLDNLQVMEAKVNELPLLRRQLKANKTKLKKLRYQESILFKLVASRDELKTYLAQLNELISIHQLSLSELKPELVESYLPPSSQDSETSLDATNSGSLDSDSEVGSQDPLLVSGIEKHSVKLIVVGDFENLLYFLRDLESLSVVMNTSNLELLETSSNSSDPPPASTRLKMTLLLTGYGRSAS